MKNKYTLIIVFVIGLIISCKKESDHFFDLFPKTYQYSGMEQKSDGQMFTNSAEYSDKAFVLNYLHKDKLYELKCLDSIYSNDYMEFKNNKIVQYNGHWNWLYDTLYYTKSGGNLLLKTNPIHSIFYSFDNKSITTLMDVWKIDSIEKIPLPAGANFQYISITAINKVFKVVGNEIRIPIIVYKYTSGDFGIHGYKENEFNENVISLLKNDTLAIIKYEAIFKQK